LTSLIRLIRLPIVRGTAGALSPRVHQLLLRQLKRFVGADELDLLRPGVRRLLTAVDAAYQESDDERLSVEHAHKQVAFELQDRYAQLQRDIRERDTFFQLSSDLLCITHLDGQLRQVNASWTRELGYLASELVGKHLADFAHPEDRKALDWKRLEKAAQCEVRMRTRAGTWRSVLFNASRDQAQGAVFAIGHDVTQLKQRSQQDTQAQKLQAVGQLAAGVAHEINTPIQYVGDNAEFLRQSFLDLTAVLTGIGELPPGSELRAAGEKIDLAWLLEEIPKAIDGTQEGIGRVAELVRALKDFAHPDSPEMTLLDLNHALAGTLTVARNELKYVAEVVTDFGALPPVLCHGGSLNQVFLNLLVNAAHAIAAAHPGTRGKITVTSRNEPGGVLISVADTGTGIPEAIRNRIFEPFFTTKAVGKGTGQGLALALAIVQKHKGSLTFESVEGAGTTFFVRLPKAETAPAMQDVA
jgi:PAS domain S-box-containing protein